METCLSYEPSSFVEEAQPTRVLIIGNELVSLHLKKWLENEFILIKPIEYVNAAEELEIFNPDVVIASLSGKDSSEFETIKLIAQKNERVLIVSGAFECREFRDEAIALGARGYVGQKSREQLKAAFEAVKAGNYCYGVEFEKANILPYCTKNLFPDATKLHQLNCIIACETVQRWLYQPAQVFFSHANLLSEMGYDSDDQSLIVELSTLENGKSLFECLEVYLKTLRENGSSYRINQFSEFEYEQIAISINAWIGTRVSDRFPETCRGVLEKNAKKIYNRQLEILQQNLSIYLKTSGLESNINWLTKLQDFLEINLRKTEDDCLEFKQQRETFWRTYLNFVQMLQTKKSLNSSEKTKYLQEIWNAFGLSFTNQLREKISEYEIQLINALIEQIAQYLKVLRATNNLLQQLKQEFEQEIISMSTSIYSQIHLSVYLDGKPLEQLRGKLEKELNSALPLWGSDESFAKLLRYKILALVQPLSLEVYRKGIQELLG